MQEWISFTPEEAKKKRTYLLDISIAVETKTSYNCNIWPPVVKNLFQHFESRSMSHIDIYMYLFVDRKSQSVF